jgi:hypothetical protein
MATKKRAARDLDDGLGVWSKLLTLPPWPRQQYVLGYDPGISPSSGVIVIIKGRATGKSTEVITLQRTK